MSKRKQQFENDYTKISKSIKDAIFNGVQQPRNDKKRSTNKEYEISITNSIKKRKVIIDDNYHCFNIFITNINNTFYSSDNVLKLNENVNNVKTTKTINTFKPVSAVIKKKTKQKNNNKTLLYKRNFYINKNKVKYEVNKNNISNDINYSATTYKNIHNLYLKSINNTYDIQNLINYKLINIITTSNNLYELEYFWNKFKCEFVYHIKHDSNNKYLKKILSKV